jgi:hypothetical protein
MANEKTEFEISYVTGLDGWGDRAPTDEERESFRAYVVHRLQLAFPGYSVSAEVDRHALASVVRSDDPELDCGALCALVGNEIWADWCGGATAPEAT